MNIDLRVNDVGFTLGEGLDSRKLTSAKCRKAGFLARLQLGTPGSETIYWAKNCEIRLRD